MSRLPVIIAIAIACQFAVGAALAQEPSAAMRFRQLRAEGVAAANAGDLSTAAAKLSEADGVVANHPGLILMRARVAAAAEQPEQALALWRRYAGLGFGADPAGQPLFASVVAAAEWPEVEARLTANRQPIGSVTPVASVPEAVALENVVHDREGGGLLASAIAGRTILRIGPDGEVAPWLQADGPVAGVLGLALDEGRGLLWAASAGMAAAVPADDPLRDRSELLKVDLRTGRLLARYAAPEAARRNFGDVAVGPDGAVYVSDSIAGDVWRLRPDADALELLTPAGVFGSPQGLALTADGAGLLIADYGSGLYRIDLADSEVALLSAPEDASLIGVDTVVRRGDRLIVVQNGTLPMRVLELQLSPEQTRIQGVRTLAANLPEMSDPAGGSVDGDTLLFVAVSQLGSYEDEGRAPEGGPPPAVIARLPLD